MQFEDPSNALFANHIEKNGISQRFLEFFNKLSEQVKHKTAEVDANLHVTERATGAFAQADEKVHLSDRAKSVWRVGKNCTSPLFSGHIALILGPD